MSRKRWELLVMSENPLVIEKLTLDKIALRNECDKLRELLKQAREQLQNITAHIGRIHDQQPLIDEIGRVLNVRG